MPQIEAVQRVLAGVLDACFQLARLEGPDLEELIEASIEGCKLFPIGTPFWDSRSVDDAITLRDCRSPHHQGLQARSLPEMWGLACGSCRVMWQAGSCVDELLRLRPHSSFGLLRWC